MNIFSFLLFSSTLGMEDNGDLLKIKDFRIYVKIKNKKQEKIINYNLITIIVKPLRI